MKKSVFTLLLLICAVLVKAQYPLVAIDTTQYINPSRLAQVKYNTAGQDSTWPDYLRPVLSNARYGDTVVVEGIVTFDPASYGLSSNRRSAFIQEASNRSWCGVEVMFDTAALSPRPTKSALEAASQFEQNLKKGRKVRVTARIGYFQGHTQLYVLPIPTQVISLGNTITPQTITIADLMVNNSGTMEPQFATGEQWEGVYVEIKNVTIDNVTASGQRWFWGVKDANGNVLSMRDYSGYYRNDNLDNDPNTPVNFTPPALGAKLSHIRGVVTESGNAGSKQYYLAPLYPDDIALPLSEPPSVSKIKRNPTIVLPTSTPTISATITDDTAVASAVLYYAVGYNNTTFTSVNMTASGSTYSTQIPAQAAGTIVKYYIKATDNSGNYIFSPDSLALNSAYKVLNGVNSISDIQQTPYSNGGSMFVTDTLFNISVPGVVVSTNAANDLGLFTIQAGNAPWSAIFVRPTLGDGVTDWKRGDSVIITQALVTERFNLGSDPFGSVSNSFGVTFLEGVKFTVAGRCKQMPKVDYLLIDSLISPTFNKEPYEAMQIRFTNAYVINENPDAPSNFGEFSVHTNQNATVGFRGENYSNDLGFTFNTDSLNNGELLPVFQGTLSYAHGNWKIYPRNRTDVGKRGDLIAPYIVKIGADTVYHPKGQKYTDLGATACDDMDGNISANVNINTSTVDTTNEGTYIVTFTVADAAGNNAAPVTRVVIVQKGQSIADLGKNINMGLYPVPVANTLNLAIGSNYDDVATVNILDITGKTVATHNISFSAGNNTISLPADALSSGIYFCQFSSKYFNSVQKFVVAK
ncbi:DUF5011 domain-containing protein [Oscillatoria amoena NRMC-F 0135]|nr:DUF5011 domain-containing protein [Oscillatoria amoena NRMC-F 0135]